MPKGNNQKVKILYLLKYFLENTDENNGVTLKDITAFLHEEGIDAERKAIYNDIETLELFGLDIEKRKSKDTTYHVISRQFELPELKLL
ncbi:MAG: WYL domain-containing protein, partial [Clostridia bacterium]|nr:WYL domain-containing protein [Clostridia bacterium]